MCLVGLMGYNYDNVNIFSMQLEWHSYTVSTKCVKPCLVIVYKCAAKLTCKSIDIIISTFLDNNVKWKYHRVLR